MAEYIERKLLIDEFDRLGLGEHSIVERVFSDGVRTIIAGIPVADVVPVVHCKDCKHSTLPSELTQRYGKPGTLTCHNMHAPSNRRNVGSNDFCSYGERRVDNAKAD